MKNCIAILVLAGACLAQLPIQQPNRNCGSNEQFNSCGSACEPSCTNPNPQMCTMQCVVGCQCRQGFFRNAQKQCVRRNQCPNTPNGPGLIRTTRAQQTCGTNEQYTQCGSACQPSCSNPNPICTLQCVPGCSCRQGFFRNAQRQCVPRNQCPNTPNLPGVRTTRSNATTGCATIRCRQGYHCVQPQINCLRTPCPQPPARCEPITRTTRQTSSTSGFPYTFYKLMISYPCATTLCLPGKRCVLQQVQCIRAPCNPIAQCV